MFDDAERAYLLASKYPSVRRLALLGLRDLVLAQSMWARDFDAYERESIAVPPSKSGQWRKRRPDEALRILFEASELDEATEPEAIVLLACVYMQLADWNMAGAAFSRYLDKTSPSKSVLERWGRKETPDDLFLRAKISFGSDNELGRRQAEEALAGWLGWWRVTDCEVAGYGTNRQFPARVEVKGKATSVSVRSWLIQNNEVCEREATLHFSEPYVAQYELAEVLPRFGMILANERWLIADSAHVKSCDWHLFSEPILALQDDRRALLMR